MTHIFRGRYSDNEGSSSAHCRHAVHDDFGVGFHQCWRKPAVFRCVEGIEYGFCKQHDPAAVAERNRVRHAAYEAKWAEERAQYDRERRQREAQAAAKDALEQIAAGHNDPRTLAAEVLALFPA